MLSRGDMPNPKKMMCKLIFKNKTGLWASLSIDQGEPGRKLSPPPVSPPVRRLGREDQNIREI